ncbi:hypothetical protein WMF31_35385 [Sorangium sp. So ce1036]
MRATLGEPTTLQAMEALLDDPGPITVRALADRHPSMQVRLGHQSL